MIEMMKLEDIVEMAKSHGLSVRELARLSYIDYTAVTQYVNGKRNIPDRYRLLLTYVVRDINADGKETTKSTKELEEENIFLKGIIKALTKKERGES